MGLSEAREAMSEAISKGEVAARAPEENTPDTGATTDLAPDTSTAPDTKLEAGNKDFNLNSLGKESTEQVARGNTNKEKIDAAITEALLDLDGSKANKFKFQGQDWTKDELQKALMRQKDYTTKTSAVAETRKQLAEQQKYVDNVAADIQKVLINPSLAEEFKKLYPPQYHAILNRVLSNQPRSEVTPRGQETNPSEGVARAAMDPALLKRLEAIENEMGASKSQREEAERHAYAAEVEANKAEIDATFAKLSAKYPLATELESIQAGQYYLDNNPEAKKVPQEVWDNIFKSVHEQHQKRYREVYKEKVEAQKQANTRARDSAPGGGVPGSSPVKMRLKDVGEHIARQFEAQKS